MEVVICAIARMENSYIKEWVDYHLALGFDHIYLYDNAHSGEETIDQVIDTNTEYAGKVSIIPVYNLMHMQSAVYTEFYKEGRFDWVAYIDIDEFIAFAEDRSTQKPRFADIHSFIETRKDADVIVLNWMTYGDSGQKDRGEGPIWHRLTKPLAYDFSIENVWGKQPFNCRVKSIYRKGLAIEGVIRPHTSTGNFITQNAEGEKVCQLSIQPTYSFSTCFVRHYITKTLPEYIESKIKRGDNASGSNTTYRFPGFFVYNPPTIGRIIRYRKICKQYQVTDSMPLKWWIKMWVKHCIIIPIFLRNR